MLSQETGLYYLQSRYYSPGLCRFVSHDVLFDSEAGIQGHNLFAYCGNNPVVRIDVSGTDSEKNPDLDIVDDDSKLYGSGGTAGRSTSPAARIASKNPISTNGQVPGKNINIAARGSTAQKLPSNLTEQLALEEVMSNPSGHVIPLAMNDPRWPSSEGWCKMNQSIFTSKGTIDVHYNYNRSLDLYDDFKLK